MVLPNCEKCTGNWKNFALLTSEELSLLNNNRYEAAFKRGEIMIKQGSPASHGLFIANGVAKTYIEGLKGKDYIMGINLPGKLILSPGAFTTSRHTFSVAAITAVQACFVSFEIMKKILRQNGEFAEALLKDMGEKAHVTHRWMVNQAQKRMSGRLAEALLYLTDEIFQNDEYEMILSRQELGELSGMAKECVVRLLKDFEESGVIRSDSSRIKILDKEKLFMISEKG